MHSAAMPRTEGDPARRTRLRSYVAAPLDVWLFTAVAALVAIGLVMVFSASSATAYAEHGDIAYYLKRQLVWLAIGLAAAYLCYRIEYQHLRKVAPYLLVAAIAGLVLVFVPHVGLGVNGGRRWIGTASLSLEPSEFAKIALVIYLSAMLSARGERITSLGRGLFPLCVPVVIMADARAQGARHGHRKPAPLHRVYAVLRRGRAVSSSRRHHAGDGAFCGLDGTGEPLPARAHLRVRGSLEGSAQHRISHRPIVARAGQRRNLRRRPRRVACKFFYLPEQYTDFIFSVLGEELGLIGTLVVVALFVMLAYRAVRIALPHPTGLDSFSPSAAAR